MGSSGHEVRRKALSDALEAAVLDDITRHAGAGPKVSWSELTGRLASQLSPTQYGIGQSRAVDVTLQRLRRQGKIKYTPASGWCLNTQESGK